MNLPEYAFSPIVLSCGEFNGFDVPTGENCDTYKIIRHHQLSIFVRNDNGLRLKGRMFTPKNRRYYVPAAGRYRRTDYAPTTSTALS